MSSVTESVDLSAVDDSENFISSNAYSSPMKRHAISKRFISNKTLKEKALSLQGRDNSSEGASVVRLVHKL